MKENYRLKQFNTRIIVSGNVLEKYEYQYPIVRGTEQRRKGRANALYTDENVKKDNRKKTAQRARQTVRRYVNANPQLNKFLTLTFKDNVQNLIYARIEFDKFVKRVKTRIKNFQYVVVIEFQKRGAIHFHLLCNLPYVSVNDLAKVWKHGFIKLNRIDNVDNVGAYVTKYMSKENLDERLIGKKCYSMSKDLNEPMEYTKTEDIEEIMNNLENVKKVYENEFLTDCFGKVHYTQVVCSSAIHMPTKRKSWLPSLFGLCSQPLVT